MLPPNGWVRIHVILKENGMNKRFMTFIKWTLILIAIWIAVTIVMYNNYHIK